MKLSQSVEIIVDCFDLLRVFRPRASKPSGSKYSVHQGDHCSGGGWDAVDGGVWRAYAKEKPGMKAKELKHVETCWNWWVVGQSALLVSSFVFRLSRHSDYNSKRVSMPTWIWRLYLSYFSRINSNSNVQCFIVKQLRCECLISYLNLVSSLFERPSHGATMRSIGPKSWWKARLSYAQQISANLKISQIFQTLSDSSAVACCNTDPAGSCCKGLRDNHVIVTYCDISRHIATYHHVPHPLFSPRNLPSQLVGCFDQAPAVLNPGLVWNGFMVARSTWKKDLLFALELARLKPKRPRFQSWWPRRIATQILWLINVHQCSSWYIIIWHNIYAV